MASNGQMDERDEQVDNLLPPGKRAAYRLQQLYRSTPPDATQLVHCWIMGGELKLVVGGRVENLGRWDEDET